MKFSKNVHLALVIFSLVIVLVSCDFNKSTTTSKINGNPGISPGVETGNQTTDYTPNTPSRDITSDSYDSMPDFAVATNIAVDLTAKSVDEKTITTSKQKTNKSDKITFKYENNLIKINAENYDGNLVFSVSGTVTDYGLQIKSNPNYLVKVVLNNTNITSKSTPCLIMNTEAKSYIVLSESNNFTDGRTYGTGYSEEEGIDYYTSSFMGTPDADAELTANWAQGDNSKGTLYAKGGLVFSGDGSLTISEGYKHAIASKDYIKINNGSFTINTIGRNGFQAVNGFVMNMGNITINGNGMHTNNQSRGIVVEGSEDNKGEGFIVINNGTLNIKTISKAITAKWDIEEDAETTATTDDPYPYVKINGGTINIKTTGIPTEGKSGNVVDADGVTVNEEIKLAPEGIEGKQAVFINDGDITIISTDDCINSSRKGSAKIIFTGGNIYAKSSNNDAIDSNGSLTISGGNIVAIATTTPECAFDSDNYTFAITGGNIIGIGTSNYSEPTASACKQGVLVVAASYLGTVGKTTAVKNSSGNVVYAFTIPEDISVSKDIVGIVSCPNLTNSGAYTLVRSATASSGVYFNGLYTTMPTLTGGTSYSGITFSNNYVYTAGTTGNQGPQEGPRM